MKTSRIHPPSWAREQRVSTDGVPADVMARLHAAHELILSAVHAEVSSYLSDPLLVFDSLDEFPSSQCLTGDYYVGDEYYFLDAETGRYHISVMVHCLARPFPGQTRPDDYLGLNVWLESGPGGSIFRSFRNTDSSAI